MEGKCYYCGKEVNTRTVKRHIKSCVTRLEKIEESKNESKKLKDQFILKINEKYSKDIYALYIAIDENASLQDLDTFIRKVWVECCGHLSSFKINSEDYFSDSESYGLFDEGENTFRYRLLDLVEKGTKFTYEYDFGSTTTLDLEVIELYTIGESSSSIEILARNNYIGPSNSPRDGVCGYLGNENDEKEYLPGNKNHLSKNNNVIELHKNSRQMDNSNIEEEYFNGIYDELENEFEEKLQKIIYSDIKKVMNAKLNEAKRRSIDWTSKEFIMSLKKDQIKRILDFLQIKYNKSDKKEILVKLFNSNHESAYLEVLQYVSMDFYDDLMYIKKNNGVLKEEQINNLKTEGIVDEIGMGYAVIDEDDKFCLVIPNDLLNIIQKMDKQRIRENEEVVKIIKGLLYYHGIFKVEEMNELLPSDINIKFEHINLDRLLHLSACIMEDFDYISGFIINDNVLNFSEALYIYNEKEGKEYKKVSNRESLNIAAKQYGNVFAIFKSLNKYIKECFEVDEDILEDELVEIYTQYQILPLKEFYDFIFSRFECPTWARDEFIGVLNKDVGKIPVWRYKGFSQNEKSRNEQGLVKRINVGRNDPCPCGSGKKFKKCCG